MTHAKSLGFYKAGSGSAGKAKAHVRYMERDHERHSNTPELFNREQDHVNRKDFYQKLDAQPEHGVFAHKLVFTLSQDERDRGNIDLKELTRDTMERFEMRNGQRLDWIAAIHDDKGHPHVHVMIRGRDELNKQVGIYPRHLKDFQEILGQEKTRQIERHQTRSQERDLFKDMEQELKTLSHERGQEHPQPTRSRGQELFHNPFYMGNQLSRSMDSQQQNAFEKYMNKKQKQNPRRQTRQQQAKRERGPSLER